MGQYKIIHNYITDDVVEFMKKEIEKNSGRQLFFSAWLDASAIVNEVSVIENVDDISGAIPPGGVLVTNHRDVPLQLYEFEENLLAELQGKGSGLFLVDDEVEAIKAICDPLNKGTSVKAKPSLSVVDILGENGLLSKSMEEYEVRHGQMDMALAIQDAFNREERLIVEAGTGTGKSVAYLIPSVIWARENNSKVVISTNTINLQEQLMKKDIPMLSKTINTPIKAVLVKGRGNYVCMRKFYRLLAEYETLRKTEIPKELERLLDWAKETESGDKSDVGFELNLDIWEDISSDADMCLHQQCPHYQTCKFQKARRDVDRAEILVVNHHLLCSDIALRREKNSLEEKAVLPPYGIAIIDEAHNLSETASDHFGIGISRLRFTRMANLIYRSEKASSGEYNLGLLSSLRAHLTTHKWAEEERRDSLKNLIDLECIPNVIRMKDLMDAFFEEVYNFVNKLEMGKTVRVIEEVKSQEGWKLIKENMNRATKCIMELLTDTERILSLLYNEDSQNDSDDFAVERFELNSLANRLDMFLESASFVVEADNKDYVYWIDVGKHKTQVALSATQISIGTPLNEWLIVPLKSFVATSATLTAGESFAFVKREMGLNVPDEKNTRELIVRSPFDYRSQVLLGLVNDTPDFNDKNYVGKVKKVLEDLILASRGRAFVLFTSHKLLLDMAKELEKPLSESDIRLLRQNQMPRHALLEEFKKDTKSVLFGTDSFWEGVDVPGEALSSVILVRLPFGVPTDPKVQAKVEHMREEGQDPFNEYYLPSAVLKFKQGFGRLIRTAQDVGCVVVLDSRIVTKNYGRAFLDALPQCDTKVGDAKEITRAVESWLG